MTRIRLISLSTILLFSSFSIDTARNISDDGLYFGNGIHNGWANHNSIVIWTRLTENPEMNYGGEAFIPLTSKQHNQLNKSGDHAQIHAAQIPENLSLKDMEGACQGAFGEVRLSYHPAGFPEKRIETSWDEVDSTRNFTRQWKLSKLQADTRYEMTIYSRKNANDGIFTSIDGSFYIPPDKTTLKNISFCIVTGHDYNRRDDSVGGHKIYPSMALNEPDFFVHTGDTEYYDKFNPWAMTEDLMRFKWDRLFALPFQREFYTNTTSYFIKDDHDLLRNDTYPGDQYGTVSFERGLEIFEKEQFPVNDKPYKTIRWGKDLQIWIMEGRNFRSNNNLPDSPDKTIWGQEQKEWFFRTIKESDATFKLIVSPTPILGPDREKKNDNHANAGFQHEGDEIRGFINQFDNVFIACGDRHWQYATHLDSSNLWEFSTGPGSDSHAGGWPKNDKRPEHRFLRVKGGYLLGNVYRENGIPILKFQHCDVDGEIVHTETFQNQIQETHLPIVETLHVMSLQANEGFIRCRDFVTGWLEYADSTTGLIPRNIQSGKDIWNAQDAAADNYPFMVLTAAITDKELFEGRMLDMLRMETKLTSRLGALPDTWSFKKQDFASPEANINSIMFGSSEYLKDGLLPLTEWLGESPWSERMISILDDMWARAMIETEFGEIVSTNMEVNGEMLQVLSRMYWMTGEQKYLDWAIRIGDYYLLGNQHPTRDFERLKLRDHGCEIISGLCELYATLSIENPSKKMIYESPIHEMIDLILEKGRNEDGLFYNSINPHTREILDKRMSDNFGYNLNGIYTVYLVDGTEAYKEATIKILRSLNEKYNNFLWEGSQGTGSSDGYADAIEGALNIYNREPVSSAAKWIDSEIQVMWSKQQKSGIIEGWHGDGNFARTTIMYCLWKTQGITIDPWRDDVKFGAITQNDSLYILISADSAWSGKIIFDTPRHKTILNMPHDWPRINQFPEWFTVVEDQRYKVKKKEEIRKIKGCEMAEGMSIELEPGNHLFVVTGIQ